MPTLSNEDTAGVYYKHNPTLRGFVDALLWASVDDAGEPLDATYSRADIAPPTLRRIGAMISNFHSAVDTVFTDTTPTHDSGESLGSEQGGHDLFLTAAGHGAGFWDGDWGDDGDTLTSIVRAIGGSACEAVYVGDDGQVYVAGWES